MGLRKPFTDTGIACPNWKANPSMSCPYHQKAHYAAPTSPKPPTRPQTRLSKQNAPIAVLERMRGNPMHYAETKYGFDWGAAKIERCCSDERKGWVLLTIKTPKYPDGIQVYVTKSGQLRIHDEKGEWLPPSKVKIRHTPMWERKPST